MSVLINKKGIQDIFLEAIESVPVTPRQSYLSFFANGISTDQKDYDDLCKRAGVMPDTHLSLKYDPNKEIFINSSEPFSRRTDFETLFKGGKIHNISFYTSFYGKENYKDFVGRVKKLRENDYLLNYGFLALSTYHLTGYNQGEYPDSELVLKESGSAFNWKKGHELNEEDILKVSNWFNSLKSKYPCYNFLLS